MLAWRCYTGCSYLGKFCDLIACFILKTGFRFASLHSFLGFCFSIIMNQQKGFEGSE